MKRWRPFIYGLAASLLASSYLIQTVKTHSEQKQEKDRQELQEYIDKSMNECSWAYPLDLVSRYQCYEKLLG